MSWIPETDAGHLQHAAGNLYQAACEELSGAEFRRRPSIALPAKIFKDGNQWCALYGTNLMEGVVGFGDSPEKASLAFDDEWYGRKALGGEK